MISETKRKKIKESILLTREKRKHQVCRVYSLKVDDSHLNLLQKTFLKNVFIEAKWFYNHLISQDDCDKKICNTKKVFVKKFGKLEERKLKYLSSQMKQGLFERIKNADKTLAKLKKRSFDVGELKFKSEIKSIPLPQYNITWKLDNKRVHVQGLKKPLKVLGLKQLPVGCDFADAKLVRKPSGFYVMVTTYVEKKERMLTGKCVGIDFGLKSSITTSDGDKFNVCVPESRKLRRLQKVFSKKTNLKSNRRRKVLSKIRREYERIGNKKKDLGNKIVSFLKNNYDVVCMQDEMIKCWHSGWFGRSVQVSALGTIKAELKCFAGIRLVERRIPSTKECFCCRKLNDVGLSERVYVCSCGNVMDRDVHSAKNILRYGTLVSLAGEHSNIILENNPLLPMKQESSMTKEADQFIGR